MTEKRTTIAESVYVEGYGVHSGQFSTVSIHPAEPGSGIRINGAPVTIEASIERPLCTAMRTQSGTVYTVEHLLAAIWGLVIDDIRIEVEGNEIPILDGSVKPWMDILFPRPHLGPVSTLLCVEPIEVSDGERWIRAWPSEQLHLTTELVYPELGTMRCEGHLGQIGVFASARTFGFERDARVLQQSGAALGASLANTVVFDDQGRPLNKDGLQDPNEPARHKWLDLVGDLALCGHRLQARIVSHRGGHALNRSLVRRLLAYGQIQVS